MGTINTRTVGPAVIQLWPGQTGAADTQVINLDLTSTVYLGSSVSISTDGGNAFPLGPLASAAFSGEQPLYAVATAQLRVAMLPGGSNYSPGSLTITGPVTAEITGPVEIDGTVDVAGTVSIGGTPTVELASGTTVDISGTATVTVDNASIDVLSTAQVAIQNLGSTTQAHPGAGLALVGTFTMPAIAAGFQLTVNPTGLNPNVFYVTDVYVNQFDATGDLVASDTFTVSNFEDPLQSLGGTSVVIRGPVLGTVIQVEMGTAAASFINTIFGLTTTAPAVEGTMYALPIYDGRPSYVYMNPGNRVLVYATDKNVTTTSLVFQAVQSYTGPASVNIENKGTATQIVQGAITSYSVVNGPTTPVTTWFSDYVPGQSAHTIPVYINNNFQACTLLLRGGTGTAITDMGITSA